MFKIVKNIIDGVVEPLEGDSKLMRPLMADMMYESFFKTFDDSFKDCGYAPFREACSQYELNAIRNYDQEIRDRHFLSKFGDGPIFTRPSNSGEYYKDWNGKK